MKRMIGEVKKRVDAVERMDSEFRSLAELTVENSGIVPENLKAELEGLKEEYRTIEKDSGRKLRIAVAGKFSCGKSQFINSLVGAEIASVGLERTTCCTTIFTGDPAIRAVAITDSKGKAYTCEEYGRLSANKSASHEVFTVELPDANWQGFEVIDTPGYDSAEEGDRQISEEAVADADVVFFLFDIGTGTIPKDSLDYLKKFVDSKQLFYLIANKADLKSEGARQTIIDSIASECQRSGLKYESILPYSSLTPRCQGLSTKNEIARANALNLARRLKDDVIDVVDKLVERANLIRRSRIKASIHAADKSLAIFAKRVSECVTVGVGNAMLRRAERARAKCEDLAEALLSILLDSAVDNTTRRASSLVRWQKIGGSGLIFNDWSVYLSEATSEYDLSTEERMSFEQSLAKACSEFGVPVWGLIDKLSAVRKECAVQAIGVISSHNEFHRRCGYKFGCEAQKRLIVDGLERVFPLVFEKFATPQVRKVIEDCLVRECVKPLVADGARVVKALGRFYDVVMTTGPFGRSGLELVRDVSEKLGIVVNPHEGRVVYLAVSAQDVVQGDLLMRIKATHTDEEIAIVAPRSGMAVVLVGKGDAVLNFDPLVYIMPSNTEVESSGSIWAKVQKFLNDILNYFKSLIEKSVGKGGSYGA